MEKRIQKSILKIFLLLFFTVYSIYSSHAQFPDYSSHIRMHLWAELDAYPQSKEAQNINAGLFDYPISRLKKTAPFFINGMVYGWNFVYTPYDKLRNVQEYFELTPIGDIRNEKEKIIYSAPHIKDNNLNCWIDFNRTPQMIKNFNMWKSITHPKIQGKGKGKIADGFDGIKDAFNEAVKNSLRSYFRSILKNKPKEISGKIIIRNPPKIGTVSGHYVVELDFFLETDKIVKYIQF